MRCDIIYFYIHKDSDGVEMKLGYLLLVAIAIALIGNANAYYNVTYLNTTVILNPNSSAHVVETVGIFVSNASVTQYVQSRDAVSTNGQLSSWQKIIYSTQLTEHIVNIHHSAYGFDFLPGPLVKQYNGGSAILTMSYYVNNVTTVSNIAPRKFEYTFNNSVFNFESTTSGQALPYDTRLNIIIPKGAQLNKTYPLPDNPQPTSEYLNQYTNYTSFSWFSGEPLEQFSFSFIITQSLQDEVFAYFAGIYGRYSEALYLALAAVIAIVLVYVYLKSGKNTHH